MKKTSLKIISLALACILLLSAFACSGGEQKAETPAPDGQDAQASAEPTAETTAEPTEEPTAAPTEELAPDLTSKPQSYYVPSNEDLIEQAFPIAEAIGAVHNKHYSKENAIVQLLMNFAKYDPDYEGYRLLVQISFIAEEPFQNIIISGWPDKDGVYRFGMKDAAMGAGADEFALKTVYDSEVFDAYQTLLCETEFIITPEDIAAAGCTATEGEEYLLAVGRCWQQKYAEFFTDLPENYPGNCYEMQPLDCELHFYKPEQGTVSFRVGFASLPSDLRAIHMNYFEVDTGSVFADESYPPEIYGWLVTYGYTRLEQQEDGSWVGTTSCHTMG